MGTRCQTVITGTGYSNDLFVNLYHHWDGYPSNMMGLFEKAYRSWLKTKPNGTGNRPEHVAAFVVASDPAGFEFHSKLEAWKNPNVTNINGLIELQGDIEYLYMIHVDGDVWTITVYRASMGFWNESTLSNMTESPEYGKIMKPTAQSKKQSFKSYETVQTVGYTHDISEGKCPVSCGGVHHIEIKKLGCGLWKKRVRQSTGFGREFVGKPVLINQDEAERLIGKTKVIAKTQA